MVLTIISLYQELVKNRFIVVLINIFRLVVFARSVSDEAILFDNEIALLRPMSFKHLF